MLDAHVCTHACERSIVQYSTYMMNFQPLKNRSATIKANKHVTDDAMSYYMYHISLSEHV